MRSIQFPVAPGEPGPKIPPYGINANTLALLVAVGACVTCNGTYTPDAEKAAAALGGIYAAGLESIQPLAERQLAPLASKRDTP